MILRGYQVDAKGQVLQAWEDHRAVILKLDTGMGKTATLSSIVDGHSGPVVVIAHRDTIVSQLSCSLAECGVRHDLIASAKARKRIAARHVAKYGQNYYTPGHRVVVASVDTLVRRKGLEAWAARVTLGVVDESHHVTRDNKWGKAVALFGHPDIKWLLPTATPGRADGIGLGSKALGGGGIADHMVAGPSMRWAIDQGYLTDYRVICADSHVADFLGDPGKSGDWSRDQLEAAEVKTPLIGDAARVYMDLNAGRIGGVPAVDIPRSGVLFASSIASGERQLRSFRDAGVRAEMVTGDTDESIRWRTFDRLEAGGIDLIIAVDIISEGTDLPVLMVGIMTRTTMSTGLYMQQAGRLFRPLPTPQYRAAQTRKERLAAIAASAKPVAYLVDHVGNVVRLGPPSAHREWPLSSRPGRGSGKTDGIAMRACLNVPECGQPYERYYHTCPYCGWEPPAPKLRDSPEAVDGAMSLLDPTVLEALWGRASDAVSTVQEYRDRLAATGLPPIYVAHNAKSHAAKGQHQAALRETMGLWGGMCKAKGLTDDQMQRLFFERFGVDVLTPLAWGPKEAGDLIERIVLDRAVRYLG